MMKQLEALKRGLLKTVLWGLAPALNLAGLKRGTPMPDSATRYATNLQVPGVKMGINYGWNRVRFPSPVPVGAHRRTKGEILSVEVKGNMLEVVNQLTAEVRGQAKPACVG